MKKHLSWALLAALAFTACESNEGDDWNGEIRLSSDVSTLSVTKAFGLDEQIKEGQQVSVWVDDAKDQQATVTSENLYKNQLLTVATGGVLNGSDAMFFPQTGNKVHIFAIHPATGSAGEDFPASVSFSVQADQTTGESYAKSDLLYAVRRNVERTSSPVVLSFQHVLSKVEVNLQSGDGNPAFEDAAVTLNGLALDGTFTPSKESVAESSIASGDTQSRNIKISNNAGLNEAIIIPQTWMADGSKPFITVTLKDGGTLKYVPAAGEITGFEGGKKYTFNITANLTGLAVTGTIADWSTEGVTTVDGTATMR